MQIHLLFIIIICIIAILYLCDTFENFDVENIPSNYIHTTDISKFIFDTQDFYIYNPQAYEEMIDNLKSFISIYNRTFGIKAFCGQYFQIAKSKKNNTLNAYYSLSLTIPHNNIHVAKFDCSLKTLKHILDKYLSEISNRCNSHTLDIKTYSGPDEYNNYFAFPRKNTKEYVHLFDGNYTYQYY